MQAIGALAGFAGVLGIVQFAYLQQLGNFLQVESHRLSEAMSKSLRYLSMCLVPLGMCLSYQAHAATLTVSNLNDSGPGSLRAQVAAAAAGDSIDFIVTGTITLTGGQIAITRNLTITGPGAGSLTVNSIINPTAGPGPTSPPLSIFKISAGVVDISGLTLSGGRGTVFTSLVGGVITYVRSGGAFHITGGTVTVTNSNLSGNGSNSVHGGAIFMAGGGLTMADCTLSRNVARDGGVIYLRDGAVATITNSTLSDNDAEAGGAVFTRGSTSAITIRNSTLSGNDATAGPGGGIYILEGPLTIASSTISGNRALGNTTGRGGGIFVAFSSGVTITNSTITGNTAFTSAGAPNTGGGGIHSSKDPVSMSHTIVSGNFAASGANINFNTFITGTNNFIDQDAMLQALADNGGPTKTHALLTGSPAINAGDPNFDTTNTPYDQRGSGFARKSSGAIDIGAYEVQVSPPDTTPPTISISAPSVTLANPGGTVTYTVTYADENFSSCSLSASDVTLNRAGTINASVSVTSGSVTTRTVTLSGITGYGTLGISIAAGTAIDGSGNTAPAAGPSSTFTVNPSVEIVQNSGTIRAAEGGGYAIGFIGNPGQEYTIEFSSDLLPPWQTLVTQVASSSGVISIIDNPPVGTPKRFYRLVLP